MNAAEKKKLLQAIKLPEQFIREGSLAYYIIEKNKLKILIGILIDSTSIKEAFFVQYFIQPLFILFHTLILTSGWRIGGYWRSDDCSKISKLLSKIKYPKSLNEIIDIYNTEFDGNNHEYIRQSLAYCYFLDGQYENSSTELKIFLNSNYHTYEWQQEVAEKIKPIIACLENQKYYEVYVKLNEWQNYTINSLKLKTLKDNEINPEL